eukprot:gene2744-2783_t
MAKKAAGLSAAKVRTAGPGSYVDCDGLRLVVKPNGSRFWLFRFAMAGKTREMGLGRAGDDRAAIPLSAARDAAAALRRLVKDGIDPLDQRAADAAAAAAEAERAVIRSKTFKDVAELYLTAHETTWRNPKHRAQWRTTLETYAYPFMGEIPVADVETSHVEAALKPIWHTKPETATRVRGRIEVILDYAKTLKWREGDNPALWRGHISNLFPMRSKVAKVKHHAALPWAETGAFIAELRQQHGTSARGLEFAILTAARTSEVLGARWGEIDATSKIWTVPAIRMKAGREHRVPLSWPALAVLSLIAIPGTGVTQDRAPTAGALLDGSMHKATVEAIKQRTTDDPNAFVFPGAIEKRPLSVMALMMTIRRMNKGAGGKAPPRWRDADGSPITPHGFRSTFRDWVGEATHTPRDVAEAALAHTMGSKTEAAYARGDLFEKRRKLMDEWGVYCANGVLPKDGDATV